MASLTLRLQKGAPVTFAEMDSNMLALDSDSPWKVSDGHITYEGKVGLGYGVDSTYRPTYALDFGTGDSNDQVLIGSFADVQWHQDDATDFAIWTDTTERFVVSGTSGNVGIGVSVPNQPLDVVGNIQSTATVIGDQGFFQSVYDGQMTITGGSIFNGNNADMSGTVTFGQLSDQTNTVIGFELIEVTGSSVVLSTSSAVRNTVDSHVAVLNARDDSEHAFNVRTHFAIDSASLYRDDSEHAWANANFDSEHNWSVQYGADIDSDATARTDSDHAWAVEYFSGIDSALDSEHSWNVQEHTTLQNNIDSEHLWGLGEVVLLNARADSEHGWSNDNFDSEHAWNVASHNSLQANIDSDHLWAIRKFDSEHGYAVDNFDSEHFWAKAYVEAGDSIVDSELQKQIRIQNANMDSEHAWNIAEHGQLQQNIDSRADSEHSWNVASHSTLQANIDSDHSWAAIKFANNQSIVDSAIDSEHAWNVAEHNSLSVALNARIDSEHAYAVAELDSAHNRLLSTVDSEHVWALGYLNANRIDIDSVYNALQNAAAGTGLQEVTDVGNVTTNDIKVGNLVSTGIRDSATSTALTINSTGDVGIGTALPARTLDVNSGAAGIAITTKGSSTGSYITFQDGTTTNDAKVRVGAVGDDLTLLAGGSERMRIDSSGNVSIGSASNHTGARVAIDDTPPTAFGSPMVQVGQETFVGNGVYSIGFGYTTGTFTEPPAEIAAVSTSSSGGTTADIIFGTRSVTTNTAVTERMRIDATGNVGIGTQTIDESLVVQGSIKLRGANSVWFTNTSDLVGVDVPNSNMIRVTNENAAGQVALRTNGADRLTIAAAGDATFSGSVTGSSFIRSGGLATQFMMADGSVTTEGSITAGDVANAVTFNNGGSGVASGTTYNGGTARTVSYNTVGAPSTTGTGASGSWGISVTGNAATATALATARTIGGVSFDGTANINLPGVNAAGNQNTSGNAATATALATARTIGGVSFNGTANINLPGVNAVGNQNTTGSAASLTTARTIGGVSFNGTANINLPGVNTAGNQNTSGNAATATAITAANTVTEAEGLASSDNDTSYPTTAAVIDYISSLGGGGTVTSVTAGAGMTQSGTNTINPTLDVVSANGGITVNADNINLNSDQRGIITQFGANTSNYIVSTTSNISFFVEGNEDFKMFGASAGATLASEFHAAADIVAFSTSIASDEKFKTAIYTIQDALEKVKKLRGVNYTWKADTKKAGVSEIGVIAQEVQAVIPQVVKEVPTLNKEGETHLTVDYAKIVGLLIEAVKDLSDKVEKLESKK